MPALRSKVVGEFLDLSLIRNSLILFASNSFSALLVLPFLIMAARLYPVDAVGIAGVAITGLLVVARFGNLGLDITCVRFLTTVESPKALIYTASTIVAVSTLALSGVFLVGAPQWVHELGFLRQNIGITTAFIVITAATALMGLQHYIFVGLQAPEGSLLQRGLWRGGSLLLVPLLVPMGKEGLFLAGTISSLPAVMAGSVFLRRFIPGYYLRPAVDWGLLKRVSRFSMESYLADIMSALPILVLPLLVLAMLGPTESAYFHISFRIILLPTFLASSISMTLLTKLTSTDSQDQARVLRALIPLILLIASVSLLIVLAADYILPIFGSDYAQNASGLLRLLALGVPLFAVVEMVVAIARVRLATRWVLFFYTIGTIITLGLSYGLAARWGLVGIGLGWLIAQGITAVVALVIMFRWLPRLGRPAAGEQPIHTGLEERLG